METKTIETGTVVEHGDVRVEWDDLGESSLGGEIGEIELDEGETEFAVLRFYVRRRSDDPSSADGFEDVEDGSYATAFPVDAPAEEREAALVLILDRVYDRVVAGESIKKVCEELSWIEPAWVRS